MNKVNPATREAIVRCLVDGKSVRATARITGTSKATVLKLLVDLGEFCSIYQDHVLTNLPATRVVADEIWAFVGVKARDVTKDCQGDIWTYTAIDVDSKLMISWLVGCRTTANARDFMEDVAERLVNRVQLTTDGNRTYLTRVEKTLGYIKVDSARLVKSYEQAPELNPGRRHSPPVCAGATKERIMGKPVKELTSTSCVERSNLTMRMGMRRFTRLANGFSRKAENHMHAVSLYFMYYNFCRKYATLTKDTKETHTTPAMAAGVADRAWTIGDIIVLADPGVRAG